MKTRHWQDWIIGLVGLWLIISPWVVPFLGPEGASTVPIYWNYIVSGGVAVILGLAALLAYSAWEEYGDIVLALWLIVSPWALGFTGFKMAAINVVVCGAVIIVAAVWTLFDARNMENA